MLEIKHVSISLNRLRVPELYLTKQNKYIKYLTNVITLKTC